jgi:formiminoglutamase
MSFITAPSQLFFSRNDTQDPRLGECAKALPEGLKADGLAASLEEGARSFPEERHFVLAGYPDDEGIGINGGRRGAHLAPDHVRKPLYKMTPQLTSAGAPFVIWDLGNLQTTTSDLSRRHETAEAYAFEALSAKATWLSIGGGHDYAFADASAFIRSCQNEKVRPLILNFDAHLDVRPTTQGLSSGTPFFRMLEAYPDVDFAELGIQGQCNSRAHLEWVKSKGARVLTMEELEASGESFTVMATRLLGEWLTRRRPVFLSIDIDGFSSSIAPGCSQSWATGLTAEAFFPFFNTLVCRLDVQTCGVYEVSPPLDQDDRTAKLAAQVLHRVIDPY